MVWNDYFDRHIDAQERPDRPIPSGAVPANWSLVLGLVLATAAIASGWYVGIATFVVALVLLTLILAYDGGGKSTAVGPLIMGGCRAANVLLGFSWLSSSQVDWPTRIAMAAIVGAYVIGISLIARGEMRHSSLASARAASACIFAALLAAALMPLSGSSLSVYLSICAALILSRPLLESLQRPTPAIVQRLVTRAILCLILLDAALAVGLSGPSGALVLVWLIPAVGFGRLFYST